MLTDSIMMKGPIFAIILLGAFQFGMSKSIEIEDKGFGPVPTTIAVPIDEDSTTIELPMASTVDARDFSFDILTKFLEANPDLLADVHAPSTLPDPSLVTKCECAIFNTEAPTENDKPILSHTIANVSCNSSGESSCVKVCASIAESARHIGPNWICSILGHYNQLKPSIFGRVCTAKTWTYTGLTSANAICCHEGEVVPCDTQVEVPATNQL